MAVAYRHLTTAQATPATTIVNTPPTGLANNDILILYLYYEDSTPTVTPPTGFTELTNCASHGTHVHQRVYWKRASSESGSYTTSFNGASTYAQSMLVAYSGAVTTGTPIEDSDKTSGSGTTITLPSVTTLTANTVILGFCSDYNFSTTYTSSDLTERGDVTGLFLGDISQATSGSSGTKAITASLSDEYAGAILNIAETSGAAESSSVSPSVSPSISKSSSISPSISLSSSVSPSISPSTPAYITGETCWGHITGVLEANIRTFASNWTGTGIIENSGDTERLALDATEYMISEIVETGANTVTLLQNNYSGGNNVTLEYRHGNTYSACEGASWNTYSTPFSSLGFVQIRVTSTL